MAKAASTEKRRGGLRKFVRESWAELRKVQWPTAEQVVQGTVVVGVFTFIIGAYIWGVDQIAAVVARQLDKLLS